MPNTDFYQHLAQAQNQLKEDSLFKKEIEITSPQSTSIISRNHGEMINFCANNYLGLSNHPELINAAKKGLQDYGYGMSSVRFICGTQAPHKQLEADLSEFLGQEDTILYPACFDANGGLFEALLGPEDAIISDALNHASIIDGIRLCKAKRYRYKNNDLEDLEQQLIAAKDARFILIATDAVFSMDGIIADLSGLCALAKRYNALVMIDDCHGCGFLGAHGRGAHEHCQVMDQVDIITGTLGKALGGAAGGFISARKEIITWLRQRSRPYLFSNALPPAIATASIKALELVKQGDELRDQLRKNTHFFRKEIQNLGYQIQAGEHPIVPVMLGEAKVASQLSQYLVKNKIFAIDFSYPVVPKGQARIRLQLSAAHTQTQLEKTLEVFKNARTCDFLKDTYESTH